MQNHRPAKMSVKTFLLNVKKYIETPKIRDNVCLFVTGNQSADLDSVVSALSFSYFRFKHDSSSISIPLINIPREDFKLRRDIKLVLESQQITEDQLYFIEDFKSITKNQPKVEITLVDHCNLQGETLLEYAQQNELKVNAIIDHHEDEKVFLDANPRIIKPNGSCSSLVFNYWDSKIDDEILKENNSEIIKLLLAPLIIDTSNMTLKVQEDDTICMKRYNELMAASAEDKGFCITSDSNDSNDFIESYYQSIKDAKKDLEGFMFNDILRKDYKQFKFNGIGVGFSSISKSAEWLFKKYSNDDILSGIDNLFKFFKLDALIITPSYSTKKGKFTREVIIAYHPDSPFIVQLGSLENNVNTLELNSNVHNEEKFVDRVKQLNSSLVFKIFNQQNLAASRKQIVPAVKQALEVKAMY